MAKRLSYGRGAVRVEMDDTLDQIYRRAIENMAPGLLPAIEKEITELHAEAKAAWPVKTGRSKAGLEHHTTISTDYTEVRGTITNDVPYAKFIKARRLKGKSAFVELLQKPLRERAAKLATVLGKIAADTLVPGSSGGAGG